MTYQGDGIMRRSMVVMAGLLSSSLMAGAAAADRLSESPACRNLGSLLERCDSGAKLSVETRASCDRIEQGFHAACGPRETISAASDTEGAALDLLREDYEVVPIEGAVASAFPNHVVVGPADLNDPDVIALLRAAHRAGKTVAIANATEEEARSFHRLLRPGQEVNCAPLEGQTEIELYGLQQSVTRIPGQSSSFCLLSSDAGDGVADRRWLRDRFGPTPPQPLNSQAAPADDSTELLTDLADYTHCSYKYSPSGLGSVELDLYTWAMRDFTDTGCGSCADPGADYYLVEANAAFTPIVAGASFDVDIRKPIEATTSQPLTDVVGLEFSDPATETSFVEEYANSSTTTVNASVGLSKGGPNVTGGETVTTNQSQTVKLPATTIANNSFTPTAEPSWLFKPQSAPVNEAFSPITTWLWFVPQDAYPSGGTSGEIAFSSGANIFTTTTNSDVYQTCNVPYPFSAWTVAPPQLTSLDRPSTPVNGGQFTITGQYLYPGSVSAVLIGGTPVPLATNVDLVDDTTIKVTVGGGTFTTGTNQVQVNTLFNGHNRFSNTLPIDLTD
jgi:hypothetical protein